jgi:hypothetical protein
LPSEVSGGQVINPLCIKSLIVWVIAGVLSDARLFLYEVKIPVDLTGCMQHRMFAVKMEMSVI